MIKLSIGNFMRAATTNTNSHASTTVALADAIDELLTEHNLGTIDRSSLSVKRGRNLSCTFTTTESINLFAKQTSSNDCLKASLEATKLLTRGPSSKNQGLFRAPRLIASTIANNILIFEGISNADSVASMLQDEILNDEQILSLMERTGAGLREVHEQSTNLVDLSDTPSPLPPLNHFHQLPWSSFESFSATSLQVWGRLQKDKELYRAVASLREMENANAKVPIHGDLRFDQFLFDNNHSQELWLIDWEEFRLGHRGRDLGGLIGEWLHIAFNSLSNRPARNEPSVIFDEELTHNEILARGEEALNSVLPQIAILWQSYLGQNTPNLDIQELAAVTAAFAGWHLYDRLIATSEFVPRVSELSWAAAGIGKNILLNPVEATESLGLTARSGPHSANAIYHDSRTTTGAEKKKLA